METTSGAANEIRRDYGAPHYPATDLGYLTDLCNGLKRSINEWYAGELAAEHERFISSEAADPY